MEEWETTDDDAVDDQDYLDSTSVPTYVAFRLPRPSSGSLRIFTLCNQSFSFLTYFFTILCYKVC